MKFRTFLFYASLIVLMAGCRGSRESSGAEDNQQKKKSGLSTIHVNGVPIDVEVAQEDEERMSGLMFREDIPEDQGMLFVFPTERILSFWMRNTFIPLDIAFINANGKIVDIQRMEPLDESKQYISAAPALYALETNAGWFEKHGASVGDQVIF